MTRLPVDELPLAEPSRFRVSGEEGWLEGVPEERFGELYDRLDHRDVDHGWMAVSRTEPIDGLERSRQWSVEVSGPGHLHLEHVVLEAEVIEDDDPYDEEEVLLASATLDGQSRETVVDAMRMVARGGGARLLEALPWTKR